MQTVCDGESALTAGRHADAIARFRQAAEQQRLQATNELAWAGLAAAYCQGRDLKRGREGAARFDEARRIWLSELDCNAATPLFQPQPFVRDQMCTEPLVADYGFVKSHPQAPVASEITARLAAAARQIERHCRIAAINASGDARAKYAKVKRTANKKPKKKMVSERAELPAQGK